MLIIEVSVSYGDKHVDALDDDHGNDNHHHVIITKLIRVESKLVESIFAI